MVARYAWDQRPDPRTEREAAPQFELEVARETPSWSLLRAIAYHWFLNDIESDSHFLSIKATCMHFVSLHQVRGTFDGLDSRIDQFEHCGKFFDIVKVLKMHALTSHLYSPCISKIMKQ